jgi:hypothetical protein
MRSVNNANFVVASPSCVDMSEARPVVALQTGDFKGDVIAAKHCEGLQTQLLLRLKQSCIHKDVFSYSIAAKGFATCCKLICLSSGGNAFPLK